MAPAAAPTLDRYGRSALYLAAQRGDGLAVLSLLKRGADTSVASNSGHTPLFIAVAKGHIAVTKLLIAHGAKDSHSDALLVGK